MPKMNSSSGSGAETVVINSGPLIALARVDLLEVLGKLSIEFLCPVHVREELDRGPTFAHLPVQSNWLQVCSLAGPIQPVLLAELDVGEAAVIQLAIERRIGTVCIDELKGRRVARAMGIAVTGALGLVVRAKACGAIPLVRPCVEQMLSAGVRYSPALIQKVREGVGE